MLQHRFPSGPKKVHPWSKKNNLCVCPLRIEFTSMIYTMYIVQYTWVALILVSSVCLYTILQKNQYVSWQKKVERKFKVSWWFMLAFSLLNIFVNMAPESHQHSEARYIFSSDRAHNAIFNSVNVGYYHYKSWNNLMQVAYQWRVNFGRKHDFPLWHRLENSL